MIASLVQAKNEGALATWPNCFGVLDHVPGSHKLLRVAGNMTTKQNDPISQSNAQLQVFLLSLPTSESIRCQYNRVII
jgi:hypothetical protein